MNRHLRTLCAFFAFGISTAVSPLFASEFQSLHVTVPFAFVAGKTTLPAGDYTIQETESHAVMIRGNRGSAIVLSSAGEEPESDRNSLSFTRTDKGVCLRSVRALGKPISIVSINNNER